MMIMGVPVTALGVYVELAYDPPFWVHLAVTLPFLLLACIPILRPFKGVLIASQYLHKAEEGRFAPVDPRAGNCDPSQDTRRAPALAPDNHEGSM